MEAVQSQLKQLILDEDFTSLQNLATEEVNLMEILRVAKKELPHSNFLAWMFSPNESHNLGDFALKEFIKLYYRENQFQDLGLQTKLSVFDFVNLDFDDLEIRREYKNIDLILISKKNDFCIVIENKIYSRESREQLKKYRSLIEKEYPNFKHKIYIFLSLFEQDITEEEQDYYVQLDYSHILKLVEQIIQRKSLKDKTRFIFEQYLQTLKSMLNRNEQIEEIAQNLYKKYKSAFDLVFQYVQTDSFDNSFLVNLIKNDSKLELVTSGKIRIRFHPVFLNDLIGELRARQLFPMNEGFRDNEIFYFEIVFRRNQLNFFFQLGRGNKQIRQNLFEIYSRHKDVFDKCNKLTDEWNRMLGKNILSKSEFEKSIENEDFNINRLIEKRFREVIEIELPKIERVFREELNL